MRLSKFLLLVASITFFALLYVHQQTEIFRLAYLGQKKLAAFDILLDKNSILRYNREKDASLIRIGDKVCENANFQMPDTYRLVRLVSSKEIGINERISKKENIITRFFGIKRQAEARTISP